MQTLQLWRHSMLPLLKCIHIIKLCIRSSFITEIQCMNFAAYNMALAP